jgi:hypothetical protein
LSAGAAEYLFSGDITGKGFSGRFSESCPEHPGSKCFPVFLRGEAGDFVV